MFVELNIIDVVIVLSRGSDTVLVNVDLPQPVYPFNENVASFKLDVAKDQGLEWVKDNLGVLDDQIRIVNR